MPEMSVMGRSRGASLKGPEVCGLRGTAHYELRMGSRQGATQQGRQGRRPPKEGRRAQEWQEGDQKGGREGLQD